MHRPPDTLPPREHLAEAVGRARAAAVLADPTRRELVLLLAAQLGQDATRRCKAKTMPRVEAETTLDLIAVLSMVVCDAHRAEAAKAPATNTLGGEG